MRAAVASRVRKGSRRRFDREENKKCACAFPGVFPSVYIRSLHVIIQGRLSVTTARGQEIAIAGQNLL